MAGGDSKYSEVDYSVLSVAVLTLGLLLVVERLRSWLDNCAKGQTFFSYVLQFLWHELATLGIVELGIWLMHSYYVGFNVDIELVFADVHFLLFYTAIINAVQTILLHRLTMMYARRRWTRSEELDINQYVLLRKNLRDTRDEVMRTNRNLHEIYAVDTPGNVWSLMKLLYYRLFSLDLARRYEKLTKQRRFHELRVHLIDANDLPKKFTVSKYLLRCIRQVFMDFVHISTYAWLALMAFVEILYFAMGMLLYATQSKGDVVGEALMYTFFGCCVAAVSISLIVYIKMRRIFYHIMHRPELIDARIPKDPEERSRIASREKDFAKVQRALFWFSEPAFVMGLYQLIQFAYAIGIASLLIFQDKIFEHKTTHVTIGFVRDFSLWGVLLFSYVIVLFIMVKVLPKFTVVTSLGQMIKRKFLFETLAELRLSEALKLRRATDDAKKEEDAQKTIRESQSSQRLDTLHRLEFMSLDELLSKKDELKLDLEIPQRQARRRRAKSVSAGVSLMKRLSPTGSDEHGGGLSLRRSFGASKSKDDSSLHALISHSSSSSDKQESLKEATSASTSTSRDRRQSRRESRARGRNTRSISAPGLISDMRQGIRKEDGATSMRLSIPLPPPIEEGEGELISEKEANTLTPPASQRKEVMNHSTIRANRSSQNSLASLIEDIPSAKIDANDINVPLGRDSLATFGDTPKSTESDPFGLCKVNIPQTTSGDSLLNGERKLVEKNVAINGDNNLGDKKKEVVINDGEKYYSDEIESKVAFLEKRIRMRNEVENFLQSKKFEFLSFVFGTMIAFFLVGMRVEVHLISDKVIYDTKNTMHLPLEASFWLLFSWFIMFIIEGIVFVALFSCSRPEKASAGLLGGVLAAVCLALLVIAESQRYGGAFGSREYGGIGDIEPFTSLILLRGLRWPLGKLISSHCQKDKAKTEKETLELKHEQGVASDDDDGRETHAGGHGHGAANNRQDAVVLWRKTVEAHPHIVEKYGEFSGQMLQAMLGIALPEEEKPEQVENANRTMPSDRNYSTADSVSTMDEVDILSFPQAPLIQPMHRGEIRLQGLLDQWTLVDIVITKYEIVCFECFDDEGHDIAFVDDGVFKPIGEKGRVNVKLRSKSHRALIATSGGQGLALSEISCGRKIVSHLELLSVDSVKVVRYLHESAKQNADEHFDLKHGGIRSEYWKNDIDPYEVATSPRSASGETDPCVELDKCWENVEDDQLCIHSAQGTMLIRFIGDLELAEERKMNLSGSQHGGIPPAVLSTTTIALRWCRSLVTLCDHAFDNGAMPMINEDKSGSDDAGAFLDIVHDSPGYGMGKRKKSVSQGLRRLASFNYGDPSVYS